MKVYIETPVDKKEINSLQIGDFAFISGTIYTARDAAHKRMQEALEKGETLPLELRKNMIYYMGPSPAREGK